MKPTISLLVRRQITLGNILEDFLQHFIETGLLGEGLCICQLEWQKEPS